MEQGDELNYESGSPTLASGLRRPSRHDVSHVPKDPWQPLVTAISWLVIGYLSDCLREDDAVCLSDTIIKKNGGTERELLLQDTGVPLVQVAGQSEKAL